jgi:hypothetical protein
MAINKLKTIVPSPLKKGKVTMSPDLVYEFLTDELWEMTKDCYTKIICGNES